MILLLFSIACETTQMVRLQHVWRVLNPLMNRTKQSPTSSSVETLIISIRNLSSPFKPLIRIKAVLLLNGRLNMKGLLRRLILHMDTSNTCTNALKILMFIFSKHSSKSYALRNNGLGLWISAYMYNNRCGV